MSSEKERLVYQTHQAALEKYVYFLLAASASAIAFAVTRTQSATLSWSQSPLGAAVVCWGISFYCGCRRLDYSRAITYANMDFLKIERGEDPRVGDHPSAISAALAGIRQAVEENSNAANALSKWQFRMIVAGAIFFLSWHLLEMALRTK